MCAKSGTCLPALDPAGDVGGIEPQVPTDAYRRRALPQIAPAVDRLYRDLEELRKVLDRQQTNRGAALHLAHSMPPLLSEKRERALSCAEMPTMPTMGGEC